MKKGFSIILAIIFIVTVASIGALSIALSTTGAKTSLNIFIKQQARLLADSAIEYAILKVQQNDFNATCIDTIIINYPSDTDPAFVATLHLTYIGDQNILSQCSSKLIASNKLIASSLNNSNNSKLRAIIINGQVKSNIDDGLSYSFTSTQIP